MKDNFSKQSKQYSQFRPHYPDQMISHLLSFVGHREMALDVATGNGQLACKLAPFFQGVYATDLSEQQIQNAIRCRNVIYKVERAEETSFLDSQFDLITVAQAIHWFDFDKFYAEVNRILKPNGTFAVFGYGLLSTNEDSDKIIHYYYHDILGKYWDSERRYVDDLYENIPFPFDELQTEKFTNVFTWTFEQLIGYLETWSAAQHYMTANGDNPIDLIRDELSESWKNSNKSVVFPLIMKMGKLTKI